jgi:amino acid adenylation domain-containing protein
VPFEMLVDELRPVRSLSHAPLFQVLLSLRNNEQVELALPGLEVTSLGDGREQAKFDLQLVATETDQGLRLSLLYATSLFDEATIARMGDGLAQILSGTAAAPETPIEHLPLLSATDRDLLAEWNATEHPFPHDRCIHELIQAQVERSPEAVALVFGDDRLSYRALNTAANRIAHRLLELGVAPDECVGVCMERSPHMVLAILGILKAGAAYVPLDPQFPPARLSHMLADCGARIVLTQQHLTEVLPVAGQVVLALDQAEVAASLATRPGHNPLAEERGVGPRHLAYVIYTSGSTGQPKGVGNEHRALVNRLHWMQQAYPLTQADRVLQKTPYSFDVSVWEFLWPLTAGASLVVLEPQAHTEPERVCAAVRTYGITTLHFVPSMLGTLLSVSDWASCASVRQVFCSGEALGAEVVARFFATGTSARLHNLYGPTEAAIDVSCWECRPHQDALAVPIGRPIQNVQLHVLDAHGRQQPIGVPGELYIGGQGLARGYCNKPDLTAERFVPDTLAAAGGRLYRTGDRARWRADGVLEFLGRLDFQVKLRGLRIELGEIESHLVRDPAVADAVLTVCGEGEDARLVAYVATGDAAAVERLKAALSAQVPAYMQPSTYVVLDRLPLNANGKVDRRALPAPDLAAVDAHAPPQTPTEAALAEIWQRLLRLETVGVEANFFELGGHSLLATRVTSEIAKTLGKPLPVRAIFEHTTVRQLAAHLDRQAQAQYIAIPTAASDGPLPLSFAQQRLWFVDRFEGGSLQYNLPAALRLTGQLDVGALQHALDTVVERHAVLRTVYRSEHGEAAQWIQPPTPLAIGRVDLRRSPASERDAAVERHIRTEAAKPFDLSADLMLRCTLLQLGDDDWVLLFTTHHIASDGWSRGILVGEFVALYKAHVEGIAPVLPALPLQYADFAAWQRDEAQAEVLQRDLAYWRDQLHDLPRVHSLPLDRPRPDRQAFQAGRVTRRVGRPVMEGLYALAREHDATVFMVLHSALAVLVGRWSNEVDVVIGTPVAGRTRKELEGLIGFFINSLVLRTDLSDNPSFRELLRRNRTMTLDAYAHQSAPFEMLVEAVKPDRHPSHAPLYQIVMAMQNHERAALALPGVDIRSEGAGDAATIDLDLHVSVVELDDGLQLRWTYASSIFDENTIERLADSFGVLLDAIVQDSGRPVLQVPVLPVQDTTRLAVWGMAGRTESPPLCAHELFEQHVRRQPDAIAAVFDGEAIGYAELNAQANRVAHYLRGRGVTPDTLVALCVERSLDLLVGVLGILKAGAAYLPLDPGYPQERLAGILDDAGIANALVHAEVSEAQPSLSERTLLLMDGHLRHLMLADQPETDLSVNDIGLTQGHLAYAIYTSGSTGKPKGVQLEHRGLVNLARNHELLYGLSPASRVLAFASIGFDGATWEWLMALAQGACLYICHEEDRYSAKRLGAFLLEHRITHAAIPPALLGQIDPSPAYALEVLIVAGEACDERLAWTWAQRTRVCNSYGPSEATVAATHAEIVPNQRITLGRPLANVEVLLLNEHRQRQPIGVPGELCLAGAGVARGYLHRPELDAERFFPHPDGYRTAGRVYRTGDLACWTPTGEIQFLGRMDQQVKIRGFRIELGEIESVLAAHALVDKAVVVPIDGEAGIRLAAYVVVVEGDEAAILDPGALAAVLRGAMRARLPDYMVPSVFMTVPSLPLTANGKVDRKALPMPDTQAYGEYVAPEGPIEAALVELWAQVLDLDAASISATASFFDLGGHSILAIKLVSRLAERFGGTLAVRDLFDQPSVRELAAFIQEQADDGVERAWSPLVPLDAGHGLPILYCVPAGGLTASSYAALALALKGRMGFKVLEPRGMDGRSSPCERMEEIVTLNVEAVLADDPQGPYLLAGHSFGGAVAFEMARLLEARGRAVRLLLLDSTVYPRTGEEPAPSAAAFLARLTSNPSREAPSTENAQCDRAAVTDALGRMLADLGAPAAKDALHLADHLVRVLDAQLAIYRSYRPSGMLSGTATLVQADGGSIRRTPATIVAGHYAVAFATPLQVRTVEGGHLTMLAPRHVASLAAALLAVSEGTQAAGVEV